MVTIEMNAPDVAIIGGGPSALAAAIRLREQTSLRVTVFEAGQGASRRRCPTIESGRCTSCRVCGLLKGVGGVPGFLGGSLCHFPAGRRLAAHVGASTADANQSALEVLYGERSRLSSFRTDPANFDTLLVNPYKASPTLEDEMRSLISGLVDRATALGVVIVNGFRVDSVRSEHGAFRLRGLHSGLESEVVCGRVVVCSGRGGASWAESALRSLGAELLPGAVDVGVRLETERTVLDKIASDYEDPKFKLREGSPEETRTLCWCRGGSMVTANIGGVPLVDGYFSDRLSSFTSVSLVARLPIPSGTDPTSYAMSHFDRGLLASAPATQSLGGFMGNRSTETIPPLAFECAPLDIAGSLSAPLVSRLRELIELLDDRSGGALLDTMAGRIYAPVIDNNWSVPVLSHRLETTTPGVFVAGDLTGLARGVIQAIYSGTVVAEGISASLSTPDGRKLGRNEHA